MMTVGFGLFGLLAAALARPPHRLVVWIGVIALIVVPWSTFQTHSHWQRVLLIPLVSPPVRVHDILGNIALYMPFGYFYARRLQEPLTRRRVAAGLGWAAALAVATEATQIFSHGRFPSVQDALANVIGAAAGMVIVGRRLGAP